MRSEATSDCPSSPPNLMCLTNNECNRCRRNSGTHEGCTASGTTPICDIDEEVANVQTTGTRKLALCVPCKKSGKYTSRWAISMTFSNVKKILANK